MEWPDWVRSASLFPSLSDASFESAVPEFPTNSPAWNLLDPTSENGLKHQLNRAIEAFSQPVQDPTRSGATVDETNGPVVVHASAKIEPSSHFVGPCLVEATAEIRHGAYVRPFSWICAGAVVGHNTEIKHSILLPGAKAPHFNYVGDSILGKDVNLGAGTKLSNLRNDGGEVHLRLDGHRLPSGLRKFGAVLGEGCQLGCNSVTNPGTVLGPHSVVWPNVTVTGVHAEHSTHR
ncbi:MAG: glucose-1-phosphate thymidylyltransferase [Candidatus Poseidoniaceae archaeon]